MGLDGFIQSGFGNPELYEQMYIRYLDNPESVDPSWRLMFDQFEKEPSPPTLPRPQPIPARPIEPETIKGSPKMIESSSDQMRIYHLIQAYRLYGHLLADTNPLSTSQKEQPLELSLGELGFEQSELSDTFPTCGLTSEERLPLKEIVTILQDIYCGAIGVEYMDLHSPELEHWLQSKVEPSRFKIDLTIDQKQMILQHLNKSGLFEWFLQTKYVGQKRFSLEGGETLIPILAALIQTGAQFGIKELVLGMAHRGRLNVLCNIFDKSYSTIFSEFEDHMTPELFEGSGDVKYHKGFSSTVKISENREVELLLSPNPSHLESVCPVVEGLVRGKQALGQSSDHIVPVLVHGDAALSGQGVVYETLQMNKLRGYSTGGTLHIVINNQIGFTTLPSDYRSTRYCTDIAKAFGAPVFHVNAEDPEACVYATNLALEIRQKFQCDVFIDMICYRKYGHNESDEPAFTQPIEYKEIRQKKSIRELYRDKLLQEGVVERALARELEEEFKKGLQQALKKVKEIQKPTEPTEKRSPGDSIVFEKVSTGVDKKTLIDVTEAAFSIPTGLTVHRKLEQLIESRKSMILEGKSIDWGVAETLAYGTLLKEGRHIRISGQDACRGTFSHRHAVWMDQEEEREYYPLQSLGEFNIYNSSLSEMGVLGFEYGYNLARPNAMTIWEAQFGDFCNGAQVIIDQYLSTGEQKWNQKSSLILFLPHGYEGQGPEHSSGRMERFLTLSGQDNMVVANPTLPAQMFHLLRRQLKWNLVKPLIVFTPKGLLRLPACVSSVDDLEKGSFHEILDDPKRQSHAKRLVLCNGRIFYDLDAERERRQADDVAIVRIEQLYPLHTDRLRDVIHSYKKIEECLWVQEEPSNMGAWNYIRYQLSRLLPVDVHLGYAGRQRCASPATGSFNRHKQEHKEILQTVFPDPEKLDVDVNLMQRV